MNKFAKVPFDYFNQNIIPSIADQISSLIVGDDYYASRVPNFIHHFSQLSFTSLVTLTLTWPSIYDSMNFLKNCLHRLNQLKEISLFTKETMKHSRRTMEHESNHCPTISTFTLLWSCSSLRSITLGYAFHFENKWLDPEHMAVNTNIEYLHLNYIYIEHLSDLLSFTPNLNRLSIDYLSYLTPHIEMKTNDDNEQEYVKFPIMDALNYLDIRSMTGKMPFNYVARVFQCCSRLQTLSIISDNVITADYLDSDQWQTVLPQSLVEFRFYFVHSVYLCKLTRDGRSDHFSLQFRLIPSRSTPTPLQA
jgi:hypothetical protein